MGDLKHPDEAADLVEREALKKAIDKHGRREFCQTLKLNYMQVSNQLNGATTLRRCVAEYYRDALATLQSGRRKK